MPAGCHDGRPGTETYLNQLNEALLNALQRGGEVFLSNAVVRGKYCLRACVVNFRTTASDIDAIIEIITRVGKDVHRQLQPQGAAAAGA